MFEFGVKDFRGFRDLDFVEIRPLTLLVGENSAGKSSFLAGLKFALELASGSEEASFNRDPFQLGTFQQISHHRGGRAGRAKNFQLRLKQKIAETKDSSKTNDIHLEINFDNLDSHAAISEVSVGLSDERLLLRSENDQSRFLYLSPNRHLYTLQSSDIFPRLPRSELGRYWPFIIRSLGFQMRRRPEAGQNDLLPPEIEDRAAFLTTQAERLARAVGGQIIASSPIRTKPLRTYTPGLEAQDTEGSHVPYELAKLYRAKNKEPWKRLKDAIEVFGKLSDMFKEVGIKSFGQSASDPFQIQFSHDGPKTNIVDLGYGTSQILPILYDISIAPKRCKFLLQQPEVHLHPKAQASLGSYLVDSYKKDKKQFVVETHSDFIVDRIRVAVAKREISPDDVSIIFFERKKLENVASEIYLDEDGLPLNPPDSYRQFFMDEQLKILGVDL